MTRVKIWNPEADVDVEEEEEGRKVVDIRRMDDVKENGEEVERWEGRKTFMSLPEGIFNLKPSECDLANEALFTDSIKK